MSSDYDYSSSGLDGFLTRPIEGDGQINLDSPSPQAKAIRYDDNQVSGALGDTLKVGSVYINGSEGNITMKNNGVTQLLIGNSQGGF